MSARRAFDEVEAARARRTAAPTDGLALWNTEPELPRWVETWGSLTDDERKAQRERWMELLLPVVLELARRTAPIGVTWSEVTAVGIERGYLWGERSFLKKYPRIYSFGGGWLSRLATQGMLAPETARVGGHGVIHLRRDAERKISHSNDGFIYIAGAA